MRTWQHAWERHLALLTLTLACQMPSLTCSQVRKFNHVGCIFGAFENSIFLGYKVRVRIEFGLAAAFVIASSSHLVQ